MEPSAPMSEVKRSMQIHLSEYRLLAEGGQSKIYDFSDDKVLRVPQRKIDYERIEYEFNVYQIIQDKVKVPKVFELITIDGAPCIVMEKLTGKSLAKSCQENIFELPQLPRRLVKAHREIFKVTVDCGLLSNHQKAAFCINRSGLLPESMRSSLLELLSELDQGNTLCHGDFHPENVLTDGESMTTIDWPAATVGSKLFDIANTYLLMIHLPYFPAMGRFRYELNRRITKWVGRKYLKLILDEYQILPQSLWRYFLICVAERTYYGQEEEKKRLLNFLLRHHKKSDFDILRVRDKDFA